MSVTVERAENVDLRFSAPPSKSFTHRALIVSALASGRSRLTGTLICDDTLITCRALVDLGIDIVRDGSGDLFVDGCGGLIPCKKPVTIDCGNSGTTLRLMTSVALLSGNPVVLTGNARMRERPVGDLVEALNCAGGDITYPDKPGYPPVRVDGYLDGGTIRIDASKSSQFVSSILMAGVYANKRVELIPVGTPASRSYLDITAEVMASFGVLIERLGYELFSVKPGQYLGREYLIEGDYSSASYLFAIAAICGGRVVVDNLVPDSVQGDRGFLAALKSMGCSVWYSENAVIVERTGPLTGIDIDMSSMPDVVQTLCAVASFAETPSYISGIGHLRYKESDRIEAIRTMLDNCGVDVKTEDDRIVINPSAVYGGVIDPLDDHRTAMSAAVMGLGTGNMTILSPYSVNKSFPDFWDLLKGAGLWSE